MIDLRAIEASTLDSSLKGYPHRAPPCAVRDIGRQGWNVMRGDLPFPVAALKESALAHNLEWMADFTRATGVLLAPHGKTTMAPQLFARQIEAGAWAMTLATSRRAKACGTGVRASILANQLVGREDIGGTRCLHDDDPDLLHVLVDRARSLIEARARRRRARSPSCWKWESPEVARLPGCRRGDGGGARRRGEPHRRRFSASSASKGTSSGRTTGAADVVIESSTTATGAEAVDAEGSSAPEVTSPPAVSGFRPCRRAACRPLCQRPVRTILRSGCYVTHMDSTSAFCAMFREGRGNAPARRAQARPGNLDRGPVPTRARSCDPRVRQARRSTDAPAGAKWLRAAHAVDESAAPVGKLNDQHAYMQIRSDADVRVGDLVGCGISHPCTTFDKWRWLPLVDDDYGVIGAVRTFF